MGFQDTRRKSIAVAFSVAALASQVAPDARSGPAWLPQKAVELVVPTAGGNNDQFARLAQEILQDHKLSAVPVVVMNKPEGNQTLAVVYLHQSSPENVISKTRYRRSAWL